MVQKINGVKTAGNLDWQAQEVITFDGRWIRTEAIVW
jgi:hypothetical protein